MIENGALTGLTETWSTAGMEPVACTMKENGALPGAELMIVGAVYDTDFPSPATIPSLGATIRHSNVPTLMCSSAVT
jgi:hypothetical protein